MRVPADFPIPRHPNGHDNAAGDGLGDRLRDAVDARPEAAPDPVSGIRRRRAVSVADLSDEELASIMAAADDHLPDA